MDLVDVSSLPDCGGWFAPPGSATPCCEPHRAVAIAAGEAPSVIQAGVAAPLSDSVIAELTTAFLRSAWGPTWPGWLCARDVFGPAPGCDPLPCPPGGPWSYQTSAGFPVVAVVSASLACVDVAADILLMGTRLAYAPGGVVTTWPTGALDVQYRFGAVPPGAYGPWLRLFCQLRRAWRPVEGIVCSIPRDRAVRSISTPGGTTAYTDKEIEQGLLGWDPIVSAFVELGIAQRGDTYAAGAGGAWAPAGNRPRYSTILNVVTP